MVTHGALVGGREAGHKSAKAPIRSRSRLPHRVVTNGSTRSCYGGEVSGAPLVFFDTNVIERFYLKALLQEEPCRDLVLVREHGYQPAIHLRSLQEICNHAKRGSMGLPWMTPATEYPGGLDVGKKILRDIPGCDIDETVVYWFSLCEEWRDLDWDDQASLLGELAAPEARDYLLSELRVRQRYCSWRFALSGFMERLEQRLRGAFELRGDFTDESTQLRALSLQRELMMRSLLPPEDVDIVVGAVLSDGAALVTEDGNLRRWGGLSMSFNHKLTFVRPDELPDALSSSFLFRYVKS